MSFPHSLCFVKITQNTNAANIKIQLVVFLMYLPFPQLYIYSGMDQARLSHRSVYIKVLGPQASWTSEALSCDANNIQVERICHLGVKQSCLRKIEVIRRELSDFHHPTHHGQHVYSRPSLYLPTCFPRQTSVPSIISNLFTFPLDPMDYLSEGIAPVILSSPSDQIFTV